MIITSNKNIKDWGGIFNDEIATSIIDVLLYHLHLFIINGTSYRIKDKVIEDKVIENKEE